MSTRRSLARLKRDMIRGFPLCAVDILRPHGGALVAGVDMIEGSSAALPSDSYLWVLVRRKDFDGWWPQGTGAVPVDRSRWSVQATYGGPQDAGCDFEIAAVVVGQSTHELWTDWVARVKETGLFPPVQLPSPGFVLGEAYRTVTKVRYSTRPPSPTPSTSSSDSVPAPARFRQANNVSGVAMRATSARSFRPNPLAFAANRRRWSLLSLTRARRVAREAPGSPPEGSQSSALGVGSSTRRRRSARTGTDPGL
jgi:hypothetical protein